MRKLSAVHSSLATALLLLGIAGVALGFRLWRLDERAMHPDEANQAVRAGILQASGEYAYDPHEHHGPTLYYFALPGAWLGAGRDFSNTTETTFRAVPAVFGAGLILLLLTVRGTLGSGPLLLSALLTSISPAMVYFSRFFIQEMLLVFFMFGLIASGWRYLQRPGRGWAAWAGFFGAMMFATKETCVLSWGALALAIASVAWLCPEWRRQSRWREAKWSHPAITLSVAIGVAVVFYSSFFTHWQGVLDAVSAYSTYAGRGAGESQHNHPWHFYLHRLGWFRVGRAPVFSEGLILVLAVAGAAGAWMRRREGGATTVFTLLVTLYTVSLAVMYSLIPYKTPWCALTFLHGMILVAGVGGIELVRVATWKPLRILVALMLGVGVIQLAQQAWKANTRFAADPRNPWCYAQTSPDLVRLAKRIDDLAAVCSKREDMLVAVVESPSNYWPLPWYLRKYPRTGYWLSMEEVPKTLEPEVVITEPGQKTPLDGNSLCELYGLRPDVLLAVHIRKDLWERFLETRVNRKG